MSKKTNWIHTRTKNLNSVEELQEVLDQVKKMCVNVYMRKKNEDEIFGCDCYIENLSYKIKITFRPGLKTISYTFDKDEEYLIETTPLNASAQMSRVYKIEKIKDILKIRPSQVGAAVPILYKNEKYDGVAVEAYEYDMIQAYAQMLKLPLPKTKTCKFNTELKKGQLGFINVDKDLQLVTEEGVNCDYVFDTMESPYIEWVDKLFKKCDEKIDFRERTEVKSIYRFAIGNLQNQNPFWRATIVGRCNKLIKSLKDENTIYCNTDSIVSATRRPDIENMTEHVWKLKREKQIFKWEKGKMNYQWNLEIPTMKGPYRRYIEYYNKTHSEKWDILKNEYPTEVKTKFDLSYEYKNVDSKLIDKDSLKVIENIIGE